MGSFLIISPVVDTMILRVWGLSVVMNVAGPSVESLFFHRFDVDRCGQGFRCQGCKHQGILEHVHMCYLPCDNLGGRKISGRSIREIDSLAADYHLFQRRDTGEVTQIRRSVHIPDYKIRIPARCQAPFARCHA